MDVLLQEVTLRIIKINKCESEQIKFFLLKGIRIQYGNVTDRFVF